MLDMNGRARRSLRRRLVGGVLAAMLAGMGLGAVPREAAAGTAGLAYVGHMETSPHLAAYGYPHGGTDGSLTINMSAMVMDPPRRRGYQVVGYKAAGGAQSTEVTVFDLDRLVVVRRSVIPGVMPAYSDDGVQDPEQDYVVALKPGVNAPRLYFVATADSPSSYQPYEIISVDLTTMTVAKDGLARDQAASCVNGPTTPQCGVLGLAYDGRSNLLYAMSIESMIAEPGAQRLSMSVVTLQPDTLAVVNRTTLPSVCDGPASAFYTSRNRGVPLFLSTDRAHLWTACGTDSNNSAGGVVAAVDVPTDPTGVPNGGTVNVYPSVPYIRDVYAYPGGDRLYFLSAISGDYSLVVFDGRHASYVGGVSLEKLHYDSQGRELSDPSTGSGVDPATGRYYFVGLWSSALVDAARTDYNGVPQATLEPPDGPWRYGAREIAVDPVARHVFVLYGTEDASFNVVLDTRYTVYRDDMPVSQDAPISNLDANTADIAPSQDTIQIYSGHAQGFGIRTFVVDPGDVGGTFAAISSAGLQASALGGEREVLLGTARSLDLSANAAQATGDTVQVDERTQSAYPESAPALPSPLSAPDGGGTASPVPYPYPVLPCDDTTGSKETKSRNDAAASVSVTCDVAKQTVAVTALVGPAAVTSAQSSAQVPLPEVGSVEFSSAISVASLATRAGKVPVVEAVATATLRNVALAPGVTIDTLSISATSYAGGRSGTAGTTVTRRFTGVTAGTTHCDQCDARSAVAQINAALQSEYPGQVMVTMPGAEQDAAQGTPHGFYAAVLKDTYAHLNDMVLNQDVRPELVGLEVVRNNQDVFLGEQARVLTELGGVEVESRYGITPRGDAGDTVVGPVDGPQGRAEAQVGVTSGAEPTVGPTSSGKGGAPVVSGAAGRPRGALQQIVASVLDGLSAFVDIHQLPLMATVWSVLVLPAYLASRRRRLVQTGL